MEDCLPWGFIQFNVPAEHCEFTDFAMHVEDDAGFFAVCADYEEAYCVVVVSRFIVNVGHGSSLAGLTFLSEFAKVLVTLKGFFL